MSTGFDEDVSHKSMLDDLARKIKAAEQTEQSKVLELKKLETDKKKYKEEQDAEISKLKAQMSKIKQDEEDGLSALKAKEQKSISIENADQEEKYKRHETIVNDGRKDLEELEKTNEEAQNKKLQEAKMKYLNYTKTHKDQYDELLLVSKQTMEKLQEENAKVEAEMTKVEDEYRRLMHEKEINEAIELEWQTKIQKFQMHEERKEKSAQFVVNMWRAWKKNKKGGKKKPKPKK